MPDPKEQLAQFIQQMKEQNGDEINKLELPPGADEYLDDLIAQGDTTTIMFMLKLGYVMGLQTGFAAAQAGQQTPPSSSSPFGPIQA
ncbi:MAG: hypothetical protein KC422_11080 [Trueperaceae bacterium]|nr:hypothetical protein [Trueperaceae bacterium]